MCQQLGQKIAHEAFAIVRRIEFMVERVMFFQPRTYAGRNYMNSFGAEQTWTPWFALTLAPVAAKLRLAVELVDARVSSDWAARIETLSETDLLAVTVMTGNAIRDAIDASEIARDRGATVVWGGPHVSLFPKETAREAPADVVVPGFGYRPFGKLLQQLQTSGLPKDRIVTASCDDVVAIEKSAPKRPAMFDAVNIDLIHNWGPYLNADVAIASRTANLVTSEGCSRKCTYCSEPTTSSGEWLTADVALAVQVAQAVQARSQANGFKLHDPNFFDSIERATAFASTFFAKLNLPWAATMHPADLTCLTENQIRQFADYGLSRVLVGLESPDPKLVKLAGKQYDPTQIPELARKLAAAHVRGMFTFIVGWPGADPKHYEETVECAKDILGICLNRHPGVPAFPIPKGHEIYDPIAETLGI